MRFAREILFPLVAALHTACIAAPLVAEEPSQRAEPLASFPVAKNGKHLIVPVTSGEETFQCLIDTGSTNGAIDVKLQHLLGPAIGTANFTVGEQTSSKPYYAAPELKLGSLEVHDRSLVMPLNLEPLRKHFSQDFLYVLGIDSVLPHALQIDFQRGALEILDAAAPIDSSWGVGIPLTRDEGGRPWIEVSVGGNKAYFLVDTGADGTSLEKPFLNTLLRSGAARRTNASHRYMTMDNAWHQSAMYSLPRTSVGSFACPGLLVDLADHNLLGLDFLKRYDVLFHFPSNRLYLKQPSRPDVAESAKPKAIQSTAPTTGGTVKVADRPRRR